MTGLMNAMVLSQSGFRSGVHPQLSPRSSSVTSSSFASPCRTCFRVARPSVIANERTTFSNVLAVKNVPKPSSLSFSVLPNSLRRGVHCYAAEGQAPGAESVEGSTLETVRGVIAEQLDIPFHQVEPHTKFADLGADSLDTVEIMMILEEKFGIQIEEEGSQKIATVKDAADLIEEIKASK